jgi:PAS domain S-box-containing protein
MNTIPDSIYVKDMESRYITANKAHLETLGAESVQEVKDKTDFDFFPEEIAERYYSDEQEVVWSGEAMIDRVEPVEDDEGNVEKWLLTTKVPYRDDNGKVLGLVGGSHDITARKEAEDALDNLAQDLARSNAELEQFAYVVSHDLQEPLRMVASYVDLISERYAGELDEKAKEFMSYAVDGAHRMQQMINDLLSYSRVSTRGKPFVGVDCNEVLDRALSNLQVRIEKTGAEVTWGDLPTVAGDESQLCQVLQNLIANAIKFRGEETPRVHVDAEKQGENWEFSVRDNGIGIDPDDAERIFVIFRRLHDRDEYAGTGIGLAICKKIVERHGGQIWVESQPGEGATFYFTLPEATDHPESDAAAEAFSF